MLDKTRGECYMTRHN